MQKRTYIKARAKEPSTWGSLAAAVAAIAPALPPQYQAIAAAAGLVLGAVGAIKADPGSSP